MNHNSDDVLRVVAYNFLSGGSRKRSGHWSRVIRQLAPGVVLAQECRAPVESHCETYRPGPRETVLWQPVSGRRWGSALLWRNGPVRPLPVVGFAGWVVGGETELPRFADSRPVRVFSIHCPAGDHGYIRTMHQILDRIAEFSTGADLVLGGDFNAVVGYRQPWEKLEVTRGERGILERLAKEFDLVSCWQAANPDRALAQTLRWSADRAAPYHCDGIFVPSSWLDRLTGCRVVKGPRWSALSDHNPVVAEFRALPREASAVGE